MIKKLCDSSGKFGFLPVVPHGCFIKVPSDEPVGLLTAEGQTTVYPAGGLIKPFALLLLGIPTLYLPGFIPSDLSSRGGKQASEPDFNRTRI